MTISYIVSLTINIEIRNIDSRPLINIQPVSEGQLPLYK